MKDKKVFLIIRDGWGYSEKKKNNAILAADTSFTDKLEKDYPTILINASGEYVGIPKGFAGNSEVGHTTMGVGRVVDQSLLRIDKSIDSGEFLTNKNILSVIQNVKKNNSRLHLIVLLQDTGVHSHIDHFFAVIDYAKKEGLSYDQVIFHLITDGRDDHPTSGISFLVEVAEKMERSMVGNIGTIMGRYYAMDRNENWDRTKIAYDAIVNGDGKKFDCGIEELDKSYEDGITDEFVEPMVKEGYGGMHDGDSVFFMNFRKDRTRQLTKAIIEDDFDNFKREKKDLCFLAMTRYYEELKSSVVFDDIEIKNTVSEILDKNNFKQLRISETEKYAHVTFFFDGGKQYNSNNIEKILIPSPNVKTYDLQPEMNIDVLTENVLDKIEGNEKDFILLNYPNGDMVGHTGNFDATVKAIEAVDKSLKKVIEKALEKNYTILLTADHGNAENVSPIFTSHTKNKVPFTFISKDSLGKENFLKEGEFGLASIGNTILEIFGIEEEKNMDSSLLN